MAELSCLSWFVIAVVVGSISMLVSFIARVKKTGLNSSDETIIGKYPYES